MSIEDPVVQEQPAVRAKQGGRGRDVFVILVVSTLLAIALVWGVFAIWAANNANVSDARGGPAAVAVGEEPPLQEPLQQDQPNPAQPAPAPGN